MNPPTPDLAPLLARRELWLLLSRAYVDPYHRQRFDLLRQANFRQRTLQAATLLIEEHPALELGPGELDPKELSLHDLFTALDAEAATLESTYRQLFGLTAISASCPPCEIEYEPNTEITYRAHRMADIAGFYEAFGFQMSAQAGERLDHIIPEAEFLYVLLAKELVLRHESDHRGAEVCQQARAKFFLEHVGWWLPAFARRLARLAPTGYYQQLARLSAALSALERAGLGSPPFRARPLPSPSAREADGSCSNCLPSQQIL